MKHGISANGMDFCPPNVTTISTIFQYYLTEPTSIFRRVSCVHAKLVRLKLKYVRTTCDKSAPAEDNSQELKKIYNTNDKNARKKKEFRALEYSTSRIK